MSSVPAAAPAPRRLPWSAWALAALGGTLRFLAVPGYDQWYLAFVCFVPLFLALRGTTGRQAFALGLVFGLFHDLIGYYWLFGTLQNFSSFPIVLCLAIYVILCSYQSLQFALLALLYRRATAASASPLLAAPAVMVAVELLFPLLFPNYLGNSPHQVPRLIQIADLGGVLLISALLAAVNAALFLLLAAGLERRPLPRLGPTLVGLALLAAIVYGELRLRQADRLSAAAPALRVGLAQANLGMFEKHEQREEGHQRHVELSAALQAQGPLDLIVWPESAYNYLVDERRDLSRAIGRGRIHTPLLFGGLRVEDDRFYNTAFLISGDGKVLGTYDKTYLLLFGEYMPFGELIPAIYQLSPQTGRFTPGSHTRPLPLGPWRLTTLICYEDILPGFVRDAVRDGDPHLLVNVTNDAWFGESVEPWIHLALAKFRAVEHRRWLVRAANTGVSAIIDSGGRLVLHGGVGRPESLAGEVRLTRSATLYQSVGDLAGWLGAAALVAWELRRRRRAKPLAAAGHPS